MQVPMVFPASPDELPEDTRAYAYTAVDQPVMYELPGINSIAKKIPLRANSKLLHPKGKDHKPSGHHRLKSKSSLQHSANTGATDDADDDEEEEEARTRMLQGSDLPTKGDLVEERLYMQYKADLWKHRATKTGLLEAPCKHEHQDAAPNMQPGMHEHMGDAVPFQFEPDGSLTLMSRCHANGSAAIK